MKYGGKELGDSFSAWSQWTGTMASVLDAVSPSAALEAGVPAARRRSGTAARDGAAGAPPARAAAPGGRDRASPSPSRTLEIHETTIEQTQEIYDFYKDKFTNLGLYNYLATTLSRLHREAYNSRTRPRARWPSARYRFERDDDDDVRRAGQLAVRPSRPARRRAADRCSCRPRAARTSRATRGSYEIDAVVLAAPSSTRRRCSSCARRAAASSRSRRCCSTSRTRASTSGGSSRCA